MNQANDPPQPSLPYIKVCDIALQQAQHQYLIESLWSLHGVGIIGGHPKSLKSWLGLDMALSIASGTPCLDAFDVSSPGPVLLYMAEDSLQVVKQRLCALAVKRNLVIKDLPLYAITSDTLRLDRTDDLQLLNDMVKKIEPRFLLLDPFVRLHRLDENNAQDVAGLLHALRIIQRMNHTAVTLVHHAKKHVRGAPGLSLRGSSDLWAWGDSNIYLSRMKNGIKMDVDREAPNDQNCAEAKNGCQQSEAG